MSVLASVLAATEGHVELPFPPIVFALIAVVFFALAGFITWSYRDVANRHSAKAAKWASTHDVHGQPDRTGADH